MRYFRLVLVLSLTVAGLCAPRRASAEPEATKAAGAEAPESEAVASALAAPAPESPHAAPPGACERARASANRAVLGADIAPFFGSSSTEEGRGSTRIVSFGLVGALGGGIQGFALSSVLDVQSEFVCGAQVTGAANIVTGPVTGAQVAGVLNVAGDVTGAQLSVVNIAKTVRGVQIGVINVARESDASVGLLNIVTNGRTHVDAWHDTGLTMAGVVHGGKYVHNIYGAGARLYGEQPSAVVALGLGARVFDRGRVAIDVDAIANWVARSYDHDVAFVSQLRAVAMYRIAPTFGVFAGLSSNVEITDDPDENPDLPLSESFAHNDGTRTIVWPGATVGVRLF